MKINHKQYDKIKHILPTQRGNVKIDNITFINALLYILGRVDNKLTPSGETGNLYSGKK